MAARYNQEAVHRSFVPGDEVLVLLLTTGKPLEAQFHGPYVVKEVGELNYVVRTPDRRKDAQLCHVNMLKRYVLRDKLNDDIHPVSSIQVDSESEEYSQDIGTPAKLNNSEILDNLDSKLSHLDASAQQDPCKILKEFKCLGGMDC